MDFSLSFSDQAIWVVAVVVTFYLILTFLFGMYFSRFNSNVNDFFFSGKRLSWWVPTMSMVATGIGSYSYLKYSEQGFNTGMNSSHVYFNDWFLFPVFLFGWLPILYFNRIHSVPEYFEKRFNMLARYLSVLIILGYIFYYIGFNLFTMGLAIQGIFGISPLFSLPVITLIIGFYVTFGGQTAVIFTDLIQGLMLYLVGFVIITCGLYALGGIGEFWSFLPETHRVPLADLNTNHKYNTVGIFWGDAVAGSIAFLYMNQGFLMRFLSIRSISQTQKAALANISITLPISALIVGGTGWLARSIVSKQKAVGSALEGYSFLDIENSYHTFLQTAYVVIQQNDWILGFIFSALMAALMSTVDSLITAASAIGVYDIYKPLIRSHADEKHYLKTARWMSIGTALIGLLLVVWFFGQKGTLMSIHYKGIMLIIPPVVTTVFLGVLWRKFRAFSACVGMILGIVVIFTTMFIPQPVYWLREFLLGSNADAEIIFFRAPFGILATALFSFLAQILCPKGGDSLKFLKKSKILSRCVSVLDQGSHKDIRGLTIDTLKSAMKNFKGFQPNLKEGKTVRCLDIQEKDSLGVDEVILSEEVCQGLKADEGDFVYVSDQRWFLGGIRSGHFRLKEKHKDLNSIVYMSKRGYQKSYFLKGRKVFVEKII